MTLSDNGEMTQAISVVGGRTLELCITKWWSSLGEVTCTYSLSFHGLGLAKTKLEMVRFCRLMSMQELHSQCEKIYVLQQ